MASDKSRKMLSPKFLILVLTGVITLLISQTIYGNTEKEYFEQRVLKLTAQTALRKVFTGRTYIRGHGKAYFTNRIPLSSKFISSYQMQRIALSGDVHIHRGPMNVVKTKCLYCERTIAVNHRSTECVSCKERYHSKCCRITSQQYKSCYQGVQFFAGSVRHVLYLRCHSRHYLTICLTICSRMKRT